MDHLLDGRRWAEALEGLTVEEVAALQQQMKPQVFATRSNLFQQGAPSDDIIVIASGRVRLSIVSETGQEYSPNLVEPGGVVGLAAALLHRPRILTAEAVGVVRAHLLSIGSVENHMLSVPRFGLNIARLLATFTVEHIARSGFLALDSASMRLARILLASSAATSASASQRRIEGLTHEDFARMVGASRTWVSLALADFERRKLISKQPGCIVILDVEQLGKV